jgi:hypothetical protein
MKGLAEMTLKHAIPALLFLLAATPAFADTYYIVQDTTTKKCTVVTEKPTTTTTVIVDEAGMSFTTQEEADAAVKKVKVCTTQ